MKYKDASNYLIKNEQLFFNFGNYLTLVSWHCVFWDWVLCQIGNYGVGYYVILGIMILGDMSWYPMLYNGMIRSLRLHQLICEFF